MRRLLLPDADVVIGLHELNLWNKVLNCCQIYLASTVIQEVQHYWNSAGERILIDLAPHITSGKIIVLDGSPEIQAEILNKLIKSNLDGLHAGELESIAIIYTKDIIDLQFCIKERAAIKAVAFLNLKESSISVEQALRDINVLGKKQVLLPVYSKKRFDNILLEGIFVQVKEASDKTSKSI